MLTPSWVQVAPALLAREWGSLLATRTEVSLTLLISQGGMLIIPILSSLVGYELGGAIAAARQKNPNGSRVGIVLALGLVTVTGLGGLALSF
jgi:hypothetical protein